MEKMVIIVFESTKKDVTHLTFQTLQFCRCTAGNTHTYSRWLHTVLHLHTVYLDRLSKASVSHQADEMLMT